jgi:hypothetical protein
MHEHDLSVIADNKNIVRRLTCNVYFCGLCGEVLDYAQIQTDRHKTPLLQSRKKLYPKGTEITNASHSGLESTKSSIADDCSTS